MTTETGRPRASAMAMISRLGRPAYREAGTAPVGMVCVSGLNDLVIREFDLITGPATVPCSLMRRPLQIICYWHAASPEGGRLATLLYERLTRRVGKPGLRIPVAFGPCAPDGGPPPSLETHRFGHTLAIVLIDHYMTQRVFGGAGVAWGQFVYELLDAHGQQGLSVLPVALDESAFDLDERFARQSFIRLDLHQDAGDRDEELIFQASVYGLKALLPTGAKHGNGPYEKAPVSIFLSHAKKDLGEPGSGPVWALADYLSTNPVDTWYDQRKIEAGEFFDREIERGLTGSAIVVAVLTDSYTSREWCRIEVLLAKGCRITKAEPADTFQQVPMVVVDALEEGESRSFPYLGNQQSIHWAGSGRRAARRVINAALTEALRFRHNLLQLESERQPGSVVLGTAPELLTATLLPADTTRVYYPDPPLGREELGLLQTARPHIHWTTPLTEFAQRARSENKPRSIALSLSGSTDIAAWGAGPDHLATFAEDLCTFLLLAGCPLAYGGMVGHEGRQDKDVDFLTQLIGLVKSYADADWPSIRPIRNYLGWPIHVRVGPGELKVYGKAGKIIPVPKPPLPPAIEQALMPEQDGWFPSDKPERRYAWACGMRALREHMVADDSIIARIALGGKLTNYVGRFPGVLEEALLTLRARKPLFLIGAFGGAARLTIDTLLGQPREELSNKWGAKYVPRWEELTRLDADGRLGMQTPEEIGDELRKFGAAGVSAVLGNGLSESENEELFYGTQPMRMVELILRGIARFG